MVVIGYYGWQDPVQLVDGREELAAPPRIRRVIPTRVQSSILEEGEALHHCGF